MNAQADLRNYWCAMDEAFVRWRGEIPSGAVDRKTLQTFVDDVLRAGAVERVFTLKETPAPFRWNVASGKPYVQFLEETLTSSGLLPVLTLNHGAAPTDSGQLRAYGYLAYFDRTGALVEEDVYDMGLLLRRLLEDRIELGHPFMRRVPPISIAGPVLRLGGGTLETDVVISIALETDIWFPAVRGLLLEDYLGDPPPNSSGMYDNSLLT